MAVNIGGPKIAYLHTPIGVPIAFRFASEAPESSFWKRRGDLRAPKYATQHAAVAAGLDPFKDRTDVFVVTAMGHFPQGVDKDRKERPQTEYGVSYRLQVRGVLYMELRKHSIETTDVVVVKCLSIGRDAAYSVGVVPQSEWDGDDGDGDDGDDGDDGGSDDGSGEE